MKHKKIKIRTKHILVHIISLIASTTR